VAGELADHRAVSARVGEMRAEGVQNVRRTAVFGQVGRVGVAGDDARDVSCTEGPRWSAARQLEPQMLDGRGGAAFDPRDDRFQRVVNRAESIGCGRACRGGRSPTSWRSP
jgi:hypothetical protein